MPMPSRTAEIAIGSGNSGVLARSRYLTNARDAALVIKLVLDPLLVARVGQDHAHAGIEEGELAVAMLEPLEIEFGDLERLGARQEGDPRALLALRRRADDLERRFGIAVAEAHEMLLAVAPDGEIEPFATAH